MSVCYRAVQTPDTLATMTEHAISPSDFVEIVHLCVSTIALSVSNISSVRFREANSMRRAFAFGPGGVRFRPRSAGRE